MLVQMWCRYEFDTVLTLGGRWGKQAVVAFRTVMLVQMWRRYEFEIVVTLREARGGRFPQMWRREARVVAFRTVMLVQMWWREAWGKFQRQGRSIAEGRQRRDREGVGNVERI